MKNKELNSSSSNLDAEFGEVLKKKERHIVSWSQEEDDILREQIHLHGSENWGIIASKFKDKTTRQCRRRWFTYLNSDFKKGGWSPEEDLLLCEAQRVYGNRWTEIAKVVSGRTDNAVKNRFTTLCKKRAKREALAKENSTTSYVNLNNKRVVFRNGLNSNEGSENALKKIRTCISTIAENCKGGENIDDMKEEYVVKCVGSELAQTFLRKDDPKVLALLQQAELLSSLAIKVKAEKTDQSLENAWVVLQDFLKQSKESQQLLEITNVDADFHLEKLKALEEGIRRSDEGSRSSRREVDVYESSPASSEYSTGWTIVSDVPRGERGECEEETAALHQEKMHQHCVSVTSTENEVKNTSAFEETHVKKGDKDDFSSPTHVTPLFRALAATIPSPKFSESEKHFLMKTLGLESSSQSTVANPSQAPSCKRSLLHCL